MNALFNLVDTSNFTLRFGQIISLLIIFTSCSDSHIQKESLNFQIAISGIDSDSTFRFARKSFKWKIDSLDTTRFKKEITCNGKELFVWDSILSVIPYDHDSLNIQVRIIEKESGFEVQRDRYNYRILKHPKFNDDWYNSPIGERITPLLEGQGHLAYNWNNYRLEGKLAPTIDALTVKEVPINNQTLKNKVVFINSWYYGCLPCMAEIPTLNELYQKFEKTQMLSSYLYFEMMQFLTLLKDELIITTQ